METKSLQSQHCHHLAFYKRSLPTFGLWSLFVDGNQHNIWLNEKVRSQKKSEKVRKSLNSENWVFLVTGPSATVWGVQRHTAHDCSWPGAGSSHDLATESLICLSLDKRARPLPVSVIVVMIRDSRLSPPGAPSKVTETSNCLLHQTANVCEADCTPPTAGSIDTTHEKEFLCFPEPAI